MIFARHIAAVKCGRLIVNEAAMRTIIICERLLREIAIIGVTLATFTWLADVLNAAIRYLLEV